MTPMDELRIEPLPQAPRGFPAGVIDEIVARNAAVSLRQERQDVIALAITPAASGDVLRFRFAGVPRRPGADPGGVYLAALTDPPPGALEPAADDPTRFAAYCLERGDIHIEMMNPGFYWIGIDAGSEYGALEILASDRRGRLALTPAALVTGRDF